MTPTIALRRKIENWLEDTHQTDAQLAEYLEMDVNEVPVLKAEHVQTEPGRAGWRGENQPPPTVYTASTLDLDAIAERHGANPGRLFDVFMGTRR